MSRDETKETSVKILTPYKLFIHLALQHEEWLAETDPLYRSFENADFQSTRL